MKSNKRIVLTNENPSNVDIELLKRYKWRLRKACWVKLTSFFYRKILLIEDIQIQWRCENGEFP